MLAFGGLVFGRPQELRCPNGDPFYENANTVDENVSFYFYIFLSQISDEMTLLNCPI